MKRDIVDDCRHWSAEMHRATSAFEEDASCAKTPEVVAVIDGNRAIADSLAKAADEIERLRRQRDHARDAMRQAGDALHFDQDQWAAFDALVRGLYAKEALGDG